MRYAPTGVPIVDRESVSGTADRRGGIAQAVRHRLLTGQQLIGIGGEALRERVTHIVVTPAPVGEVQ
ncbi:hypothetical protein [Nocardia fusca]|uniref:Uncharacterized protein n=1 Tax=Nocardia fusca TaxID=941183 RepID=A0ABV3FF44_9NOCA